MWRKWEATIWCGPIVESGFIGYVRRSQQKARALAWVGPFVFDGAGWRGSTSEERDGFRFCELSDVCV